MADIDGRSTVWAFPFYPESMPKNWLDIARDLHTLGAISPLHDSDLNPDGSKKVPHYHMLLKFPSKKSETQIKQIARKFGYNGPVEAIDNFDGYLRYLSHVDNPEKAQYEPEKIIPLCGLDVLTYFAPSKSRAAAVVNEIVSYLLEHPDIEEFDVLRYKASENKQWVYVLDNTPCYGVVRMLNSRRYRSSCKKKEMRKND